MLNQYKLYCKITDRVIELFYDYDWIPEGEKCAYSDICACMTARKGFCQETQCSFWPHDFPSNIEKGDRVYPFHEDEFKEALGVDSLHVDRRDELKGVPAISLDLNQYKIYIVDCGPNWKDFVLLVSDVKKCSLSHARMLAKTGGFELIEGTPRAILNLVTRIEQISGVVYNVTPDFPHFRACK